MGSALLFGSVAPARVAARVALEAAGWEVVDHDGSATRSAFDALSGCQSPYLLVFLAEQPRNGAISELSLAAFRDLESVMLVEPWTALREAARCFTPPGCAVLLVADVAGQPGVRGAFASAAQRALRTMVAAAAVEFAAREHALRVNLLEYDAGKLDAAALQRAVTFLAAPGSGFMTGTHLSVAPAVLPEGAPPATTGDES